MIHHTSLLTVSILSFISFFSTISPINCLIVYLALTNGLGKEERTYVMNRSLLTATIVTIVFMLIGPSGFARYDSDRSSKIF